jgi:hypothetical protein
MQELPLGQLKISIMRLIIYLFVSILMGSCNFNKIYRITGIDLDSIRPDSTSLIRFDGLYSLYETSAGQKGERYKTYSPLIFLNSQKVKWGIYGGSYNFDDLKLSTYRKYPFSANDVGDYVVHDDTIWAKIPVDLYGRGGLMTTYEVYFQGGLKNRDTIVNWHMIPPYPKVRKMEKENFKFLLKPNMLYFIEGKELLGLDSLYQQRLKEQVIKK